MRHSEYDIKNQDTKYHSKINSLFNFRNIPIQPKLIVSKSDDPYEREADKVSNLIVNGSAHPLNLPILQKESHLSSILHRQEQKKSEVTPNQTKTETSTKDKLLEGAKKTGEAFLETNLGKSIKTKAEDFAKSPSGGTITGIGVVSALSVIAITNSSLPMQPPAVPLDFITPGLKAKIIYEGPVQNPTSASVQFIIPFGPDRPSQSKNPTMTKSEKYRAETAKMAQEQAQFRESLKSPEQKKAEDEEFWNTYWLMQSQSHLNLGSGNRYNFDYSSISSSKIRPKLKVNQPNNQYEKEADRVSDQIMKMSNIDIKPNHRDSQINRKCSSCNMKEDNDAKNFTISTKPKLLSSSTTGFEVPNETVNQINTNQGRPLDSSTKSFMEPRFGYDFSDVRIHDDSKANELVGAVNARAFTYGNAIFMGKNESTSDKELMAHELTHVVQQNTRQKNIQRSPNLSKDSKKRSIQLAIKIFEANERYYKNEKVEINQTDFGDSLNRWYGAILAYDKKIDTQLNGDPQLKKELRDSYIRAIHILITRAATKFGKSESDLYRENNGRIPMWAWNVSHHMESSISTPIADGRTVDSAGQVNFSTNGFDVIILPDITDPKLASNRAETEIEVTQGDIGYMEFGGSNPRVSSITGPTAPTVKIQTAYGSGVSYSSSSGYGRGTTPEDIAGGKVSSNSTSLGFHEGNHGLDFIEYMENNAPPEFKGKAGSKTAFDTAVAVWHDDYRTYIKKIKAFSVQRTGCVGTTIDEFNKSNSKSGAVITIHCP